jgi:hypothetical protein
MCKLSPFCYHLNLSLLERRSCQPTQLLALELELCHRSGSSSHPSCPTFCPSPSTPQLGWSGRLFHSCNQYLWTDCVKDSQRRDDLWPSGGGKKVTDSCHLISYTIGDFIEAFQSYCHLLHGYTKYPGHPPGTGLHRGPSAGVKLSVSSRSRSDSLDSESSLLTGSVTQPYWVLSPGTDT